MPGTAARTFACAADLLARVRKLRYEGIAIASRIPRMMITTRSSIRVKPPSSRCTWPSRFESHERMRVSSLGCAVASPLIGRDLPQVTPPDGGSEHDVDGPSRKRLTLPIAREGHAGDPVFDRRPARADGDAKCVGSAHHRGRAPGGARARPPRAPAGLRAANRRRDAAAALPHPLDRAAEAPRARPPDRPRALDPRSRALPRERVLAARVPRRGLPPDPDRDQDPRGAGHPVEPARAHRPAPRPRSRYGPDRLR